MSNYRVNIHAIQTAPSLSTLQELIQSAVVERNCEIDSTWSYEALVNWYTEEAPKAGNGEASMWALIALLKAAIIRRDELKSLVS